MVNDMKIRNIPFGYYKENGKTVILQSEAEVISSIYNMYISGETLKAIADTITERGITYFEENRTWNKNMVSRILEDERYLGNNGFPQIVDSDKFNKAKAVRSEKGCPKAVLSPLMTTVKEMFHCSECGKTFRRVNKWRSREKWLCSGGCKCGIYLDDKTICEGILSVMNAAIRNPNLLIAENNSQYEPSPDVVRKTNEVYRMIDQPSVDFHRVAEAILGCAAERYRCCTVEVGNSVSQVLSSEYDHLEEQKEINAFLLKRTVTEIKVNKDGHFTLTFIGNVRISDNIMEEYNEHSSNAAESGNEN